MIADLTRDELQKLYADVRAAYDAFKTRGLKLDMTRGKPAPEQLDLADGLLALPGNGDYYSDAREDGRNYGNVQGLAEARTLFSRMMGAPAERIVVGDNARLDRLGAAQRCPRFGAALVERAGYRLPLSGSRL